MCDESALALHELIDDIPAAVHIAVPRGTRRPTISYPPTVVAQYAPTTFTLGVERFEAWPELRAALRLWHPVCEDQITPISLSADPVLAQMITPDRGREILATSRGTGPCVH